MKTYIMTDLEGVAGVMNSGDWLTPAGRYYETGRRLLTNEVNAAIRGLAEGGFKEFIVQDGHGAGAVDIELLDPRARLQRGWPYQNNRYAVWPFGLDESFQAVAFVGQHAKAGTPFSHLTHTGYWNQRDVAINNVSVGEYGQMALNAGDLNVPVIFASGEKALGEEAAALTPWALTAAVKEGTIGGTGDDLTGEQYEHFHEGAIHLQPQRAREVIFEQARAAARKFVQDPAAFKPLKLSRPCRLIARLRPFQGRPAHTIEVEGRDDMADLLNAMVAEIDRHSA